jgi:hydrogenase nickel incorporation protein HypB
MPQTPVTIVFQESCFPEVFMKSDMFAMFSDSPVGVAVSGQQMRQESGFHLVYIYGRRGVGKTTLIHSTIRQLSKDARIGVIFAAAGGHEVPRSITEITHQAVAIPATSTGLDNRTRILAAVSSFDPWKLDFVFIEDLTPLAEAGIPELDQSLNIQVLDVSDARHDLLNADRVLLGTSAVVLNKIEMAPSARNNISAMQINLRAVHRMECFPISAQHQIGMAQWENWLRCQLEKVRPRVSDWFG